MWTDATGGGGGGGGGGEGAQAGKACRKLLRAYVRELSVTGREGAKAEVLSRI